MGPPDAFDPQYLALDCERQAKGIMRPASDGSRRRTSLEPYVSVSLPWFNVAARASKSAATLATALLIYRAALLQRTLEPRMPTQALRGAGVGSDARRRALRALTNAGLIETEPRTGKSPNVRVCCPWLEAHLESRGTTDHRRVSRRV